MKKIVTLALSLLITIVWAQTPPTEFAVENDPGYTQKLIDFNQLVQQNRFEQPFHIENWTAELDGSVNFSYNKILTHVRVAKDNNGRSYLGIRINFPRVDIDTYAAIKPVFPIPFLGARFFEKGFIDNVGEIRSIRIKVNSNIFPYNLVLVLQDKQGYLTEHRFNRKLDFYGWKTLEWKNSQYDHRFIYDPDEKKEPIYPLNIPGIRFYELRVTRDWGVKIKGGYNPRGTDFVGYIDYIELTYDKAVNNEELLTDKIKKQPDYIENEDIWQIEAEQGRELVVDGLNKEFDKYKLNLRLQRARKNLSTPEFKLQVDVEAGRAGADQQGANSQGANATGNQ